MAEARQIVDKIQGYFVLRSLAVFPNSWEIACSILRSHNIHYCILSFTRRRIDEA